MSDKHKVDDEAVVDRGASYKHLCDEEEVEGHHTVYIGVHVPKSLPSAEETQETVQSQGEERTADGRRERLDPTLRMQMTLSPAFSNHSSLQQQSGFASSWERRTAGRPHLSSSLS
ncbi:hypothetical protein MHYP_G00218880 [Metynnis hypsauchen]